MEHGVEAARAQLPFLVVHGAIVWKVLLAVLVPVSVGTT